MIIDKKYAPPFEKGINMTNWLEFRSAEQIDENYLTKQDFVNAKSIGCDVLRLPIHFEKICNEGDGYLIPQKIYNILDKVVSWCDELKMYIIFDFHNDCSGDSVTPPDIDKVLAPVWTQLASRYKDSSEYIIYEIMNEPHAIDISLWNSIIARIFAMIREIDTRHWIIVGGADWNSTAAMKTLPDFNDDKVIYTFHYYDPHTFTHQGASWCHMERVMGLPFPYDEEKMPPLPENPTEIELRCFNNYKEDGQLYKIENFFDQYVEFSNERQAPVFCGEFGCCMTVPNDLRVKWYRIVGNLLNERNIAHTSWDWYGSFGIFKSENVSTLPKFPEDLNIEVIEAMGFKYEG